MGGVRNEKVTLSFLFHRLKANISTSLSSITLPWVCCGLPSAPPYSFHGCMKPAPHGFFLLFLAHFPLAPCPQSLSSAPGCSPLSCPHSDVQSLTSVPQNGSFPVAPSHICPKSTPHVPPDLCGCLFSFSKVHWSRSTTSPSTLNICRL